MPTEAIAKYLSVVAQHGGEATTTEIRAEMGLTNQQVNYRHSRAEDEEFVEIENPGLDSTTRRQKPKRATLTTKGKFFAALYQCCNEDNDEPHSQRRSAHDLVTSIDRLTDRLDELIDIIDV